MPPIYRDVHPDRAPVELYDEEGKTIFRFDLDTPLVVWADKLSAREKVSFNAFMIDVILKGMQRIEEQLREEEGA